MVIEVRPIFGGQPSTDTEKKKKLRLGAVVDAEVLFVRVDRCKVRLIVHKI